MIQTRLALSALILATALTGCARNKFDETGGLQITRSNCPAVAIPAYTGDLTIFSPEQSQDLRALDVTATLTNLQTSCNEAGDPITVSTTFDVVARRASASGARQVVVPYFATVMRGGTQIMSKQIGQVALDFADGQLRTTGRAQANAAITKSMAMLPPEVQAKITRKRKPTDADASIDPMNDPSIRSAVSAASFELLIGFQLTPTQLAYNATR